MSHEEIMRDLQSPQENKNLDTVNVVRCKDCKFCYSYRQMRTWGGTLGQMAYICDYFNVPAKPDNYCSRGERRDEAR